MPFDNQDNLNWGKPAIDSAMVRAAALSVVSYLAAKYGIPEDIMTPTVKSLVVDFIVIGGGALIAYLRKSRTHVQLGGWFFR